MAGYATPEIVQEAITKYDKAYGHHNHFCKAYERRERAYRGILRSTSGAARWRHTMHQPYAFGLIETIVSSTVEMGLVMDVRPSPRAGLSMEEAQALLLQADVVRNLIKHEHDADHMDRKQRPLYLCDSIGGRGIGKSYWNWSQGTVKKQGITDVVVHDEQDNVIGTVPQISEIETDEVLFDNSTFEVIDPRDFIVHESAKTLQPRDPGGAQHVFHRGWYSMEQLRALQSVDFLSNVEKLTETLTFSDEYTQREKELWNINRTKDLVEVLEYWAFKKGKVWRTIIGNRNILLRPEEANPFWHQNYPFIVSSSMPQPFSMIGMSDMELIEQLQEMLWELENQRLDNLELINNAIMLIRADIDDPDAFQYYPGAQWQVDSTDQVKPLIPPYQLANVSLEAEALLKGDLQAVSSAAPLAGGNTQGAGPATSTATGASLVMSAAQERLAHKKFQAQMGLQDEAQMRLKNCQQFISDKRLLHILGPSGKLSFKQITPLDIQGEYTFHLRAVNDSQNRAEKKAEAGAVLQMLKDFFPMSYASGTPIDLHEALIWYFRACGLEDEAEAFFEPKQQPDPATMNVLFGNAPHVQIRANTTPGAADAALQSTGSGGQQTPNMGTTAATAVDAQSPSASGGVSMSGAQFLQRARALQGGVKGR
jgi:hypothetical protein